MSKKYRLSYFKNGIDSLREKYYPTLLDAKTNIPCVFKFQANCLHNNREHFKIFQEEHDLNTEQIIISNTYIYVKNDNNEIPL